MNDNSKNLDDIIHSIAYIESILAINKNKVTEMFDSGSNNINVINSIFAENHKLIQMKNKLLQNDKIKHLSENDLYNLKIIHLKKFY